MNSKKRFKWMRMKVTQLRDEKNLVLRYFKSNTRRAILPSSIQKRDQVLMYNMWHSCIYYRIIVGILRLDTIICNLYINVCMYVCIYIYIYLSIYIYMFTILISRLLSLQHFYYYYSVYSIKSLHFTSLKW